MPITKNRLRALHDRVTRAYKDDIVARRGRCDITPRAIVRLSTGQTFTGSPGPKHPDEMPLVDVLAMSIMALTMRVSMEVERRDIGLRTVILICEGYQQWISTEGEQRAFEDYEFGEFERDFLTNPNTTVKETAMTTYYEWHRGAVRANGVFQPFHYDDGGLLVWEEPYDAPYLDEGRMADVMRTTFAMLNEARQ